MSRLSFRPRPLDIHKKLPIVKSIKDLDNDDSPGVSRTSQHGHNALDTEVLSTPTRRTGGSEIPTPQYVVVDSYEKDYTQTFNQPSSYLRGRGARNESTEYVEYDLDDEDEDWLQLLNNERKILSPERFESMLYRMEIMDHKSRERSGVPTVPGQPIPVALPKESAVEALRPHTSRQAVLAAVYDYWRAKRERWQKPILRRLQPPPPVNDTNPFNVFRPREKVHRPHTRRMQRRENDVQSFEKLRQVRRNLEHARDLLQLLQKREEKKRELVECEVMLQKGQIRSRHDARQDEDGIINNSMLPPLPQKLKHTDDYLFKSRTNNAAGALDQINGHSRMRTAFDVSPPATDGAVMAESMDQLRRKRKRRRLPQQRGRPAKSMAKMESLDPVLLFTQPLDPEKLAAAGIKPPLDPPVQNGSTRVPTCWHGRYGRGGRIIFDRWNFKNRTPLGSSPVPFSPNPVPSALERFHSPPPPRLGVEGAAEPPGMDTNAAAIPDTLQV